MAKNDEYWINNKQLINIIISKICIYYKWSTFLLISYQIHTCDIFWKMITKI